MNGASEVPSRKRLVRGSASLILSALAVLIFTLPSFAQVNTGRILGTVTDQSGGAIANSAVVVTNSATGVVRNLTADSAGAYVAPDLNAGTYSVKCTAMGFQTFERQNVQLQVGVDARVDCQLTPGAVTQTIQVTESALQLDTSSAVVSGTLSTENIVDLPLKARNFQDFLALRPGVMQTPGGGTLTTAVHGLAPNQNNNFIEGLDTNDPITGQNITNTTLPLGDAGTILPIDAIQEINVETNAPAEFGRRPGAVINVGLKTGGNAMHGTAFAFGRSDALNATDFTIPASPRQPMDLEQWGGTLGGPIKKNKLFYFGAFERQSYSVGTALPTNTPSSNPAAPPSEGIPAALAVLNNVCATAVPTPAWCGKGSGTIDGVSAANVNPLSTHLLQYFGPANNTLDGNIVFGFPDVTAINNAVAKVDWHPSDHHTFTSAYFWGGGHTTGEDGSTSYTEQIFDIIGTLKAQLSANSWTWTPNATWVNDLRFGWNHYLRNTQTGDYKTPASAYGLVTGVTDPQLLGFPTIVFDTFSNLGGSDRSPRNFGPGNDYDIVDHVSYLHGKHAFKFGGEMLYLRTFFDQIPSGRGDFNFTGAVTDPSVNPGTAITTGLEAFLAGLPDTVGGSTILQGSPARTYNQWDFSGFFEDSWRATSKLTVNLGFRYEYNTPLSEDNNLIGSWSPTAGLEQVGHNGFNSAYNGYTKDFSPRAGIAWDVTGKGTTVVRVGGGIYYDNPSAASFFGLQGNLPGKQIGFQAIPTGSDLYAPNGVDNGPLVASGGMATQTVSINAPQINWTLNGAGGNILQSFPKLSCGNGLPASQAPGGVGPGVPANFVNPSPCSIFAVSPNLPSPEIFSWNAGVQHALTSTVTFEVNYIGNHGARLTGVTDMNQISAANQAAGNGTLKNQLTFLPFYSAANNPYGVAYPYLQYINFQTDSWYSNYNGLEATLTARNFHGLSVLAGYTFSRGLTEQPATGYSIRTSQNPANPQADYSPTAFDIRHNFTLSPSYNLPDIKKAPWQLLEGWSLQSAISIHTGFPWFAAYSKNLSGTNENADRWDFFGNPSDFVQTANPNGTGIPFFPGTVTVSGNKVFNPNMPSQCITEATAIGTYNSASPTTGNLGKLGCFMDGNSVLLAPPNNTFGNEGRNIFRGPGFANVDFSVFKNTKIREWLNAQFRWEVYNILNHQNLATGSGSITSSAFAQLNSTWDQASTNPVLGTGGARSMQFGLKLIF